MEYYSYRRGAKDAKPTFKFGEETTNKIVGKIKGIYINEEKEVNKRDGSGQVTIPANINVVLESDKSVSFSLDGTFRAVANSLLSANIGDNVEFFTYTNKEGYKTVSVTNPDVKKIIEFERDGEKKTAEVNESYMWAVPYKEVPVVEKTEFGGKTLYDDSKANKFFTDKLKEKFSKEEETPKDEVSVEDLPF